MTVSRDECLREDKKASEGELMDAKKLPTIDEWIAQGCDERAELIEGDFVYKA